MAHVARFRTMPIEHPWPGTPDSAVRGGDEFCRSTADVAGPRVVRQHPGRLLERSSAGFTAPPLIAMALLLKASHGAQRSVNHIAGPFRRLVAGPGHQRPMPNDR